MNTATAIIALLAAAGALIGYGVWNHNQQNEIGALENSPSSIICAETAPTVIADAAPFLPVLLVSPTPGFTPKGTEITVGITGVTVNRAGYYSIEFLATWTAAAYTNRAIEVTVNGVSVRPNTVFDAISTQTFTFDTNLLAVGDLINLNVAQTSGGAETFTGQIRIYRL